MKLELYDLVTFCVSDSSIKRVAYKFNILDLRLRLSFKITKLFLETFLNETIFIYKCYRRLAQKLLVHESQAVCFKVSQ